MKEQTNNSSVYRQTTFRFKVGLGDLENGNSEDMTKSVDPLLSIGKILGYPLIYLSIDFFLKKSLNPESIRVSGLKLSGNAPVFFGRVPFLGPEDDVFNHPPLNLSKASWITDTLFG